MLDILKAVHKYVPMIERTTSVKVVVDEVEEEVRVLQQDVQPVLFGGDQMTIERGRSIQNVLSNSDNAAARLEGLTPVVEDWYTIMCLYKVLCVCVCVVCSLVPRPTARPSTDRLQYPYGHICKCPLVQLHTRTHTHTQPVYYVYLLCIYVSVHACVCVHVHVCVCV